MRRILLLEEVVKNVAENNDKESCIFGTKDFYFKVKDGKTKTIGPYDFYFYFLQGIPENLDKQLSAIPYIPGTINDYKTIKRIRQLKDRFPFLEAFAIKEKTRKTTLDNYILSVRKFRGNRPVSEFPRSPYEIYRVKTKELEDDTSNSKILIEHIMQKITEIENRYHV